jgi:cytochrome c biogenesis protein CcmG/thiol:disulfide interchange protein DsbE
MKIRAWNLLLLSGIAGLLALFYVGLWGNPSYIPPVIVNTPASDFTAPELYEGHPISLSQFKGKVVMLNFWASWCQECKLEHASLLAINEQFGKLPNFVMLGVNYQDQVSPAKKYLEVHGNNFQHVRDETGKVSIDYGIYGVPETFIIDPQGMIRHKSIGPIVGANYTHLVEKVIQPLLEGKPL